MKTIRIVCFCLLAGACIGLSGCGNAENSLHGFVKENREKQIQEQQTEEIQTGNTVLEDETENTEWKEQTGSASSKEGRRIICWGDSLTYGQGGDGVTYPLVLSEKTGLEVINYGIQGETARQIAIRMGALTMTTGAFEIPPEAVPVEVTLWQDGEDPIMMRLGDCAINPCNIGGVEGTLTYNAEEIKYYFTRSNQGEAVSVPESTVVETFASLDKRESDIIILFAGTNLPPDKDTVGELIATDNQMLEELGTERYIVIGLTSKALIPDIEPINEALSEAFGEHFLDIRTYMLAQGLQDAGIEPTEQDIKDMEEGEIPSSIRVDEVHGTDAFYRIIGEQVYEKLKALGYLSE